MDTVMHNSSETEAIRQRMEDVRRDLDEDVQGIVEGARELGKWRTYVRNYPWVCLGTAMAIGYWLVPRRPRGLQPDAQMLGELAKQCSSLAASPPKSTVRSIVGGIVGSLVMRGVTSFVEQQTHKFFANETDKPQQDD